MKKLAIAVTLISSLTAAVDAYAGSSVTRTVSVAPYNNGYLANGAITAAARSRDTNEYIGCSIEGDPSNGATATVQCFARNSGNATASCYAITPALTALEVVASINTSSYLLFETNSSGQCTYISVNNDSTNL